MGIFSKKPEPASDYHYRGGCASHDMYGPARKTPKQASRDADAHTKRMHGGGNPSAYVEARPDKKGGKR